MDLEKLKAISGDLKKNQEDRKKSNGGDWPKATFMPDGNHKGRFIFDPKEEIYAKYETYGYFANGIRNPDAYKDQWPEGFNHNEIADLSSVLTGEYKIWKYGLKTNFLVYFYLTETDAKSDDWTPGTLYCIIGNWKFEDAFTDMLSGMVADAPEKVLASLDPSKPGPIFSIVMQGGNQGKCNISPTFKESDPIKLEGQGYKDLQMSYIRPGFDLEKYNKLRGLMKADLDKASAARRDAKPEEGTDKKEEEKPKADSTSNTPAPESSKPAETGGESTDSVSTTSAETPKADAVSEGEAGSKEEASSDAAPAANPFARFMNNKA